MRETGKDPLILDAGDLFFSTSKITKNNKKSELFRAEAIVDGYSEIGCDAINIGHYEVLNGLSFLKKISDKTEIPFLSANLKKYNTDELIFEPFKIINKGGLNIGIIGLMDNLPDTSKSMKIDNYLEAGNKYIKLIFNEVDVIVLLVNIERGKQATLAKDFPEADFIITSGSTNMTRSNTPQEQGGPLVYSCGKQGKYLLTVDVGMKNPEEPFVDVSAQEKNIKQINKRFERLQKKDPNKSLEEIYADQSNVLKLIDGYKTDMIEAEKAIESAINTLEYKNIALSRKVQDNTKMLDFVNSSLLTCTTLDKTPKPNLQKSKSDSKKRNKLNSGHSNHDGHNH